MEKIGADDNRFAALEARVAALERAERERAAATTPPEEAQATADPFWALTALKGMALPASGAVLYAGVVETPQGPVEWQYGTLAEELFEQDWSEFARSLGAIGNPVRLSLLQAILRGTQTVAELSELATFGTSGQVYHHINNLVAAGWLAARTRGRYVIPADRVVPLLVILTAAKGRSL
ncbi:MAG TPA: winged helix-turn-helix domain-containing protein [Thermomicrobiales bacterium]